MSDEEFDEEYYDNYYDDLEEECEYDLSRSEVCYECSGYGDDYFVNEKGELECRCRICPCNPDFWDD